MGILLRFPCRSRAQRVANGAAASLACQEASGLVWLYDSVERDSHCTLSAGRALDRAWKTELCRRRPTPRLLPHGLRAPQAPRTNQQVFRASHTLKLKRQALKYCAAWCFKKSHLSPAFMQLTLVLFTLSSCAGNDPCHPGRRTLSLCSRLSPLPSSLGPGVFQSRRLSPSPVPCQLSSDTKLSSPWAAFSSGCRAGRGNT